MALFELMVCGQNGICLKHCQGENEVIMSYRGVYQPGDYIMLKSDIKDIYIKIRLDDSLEESWVYLTDYEYKFKIPFDNERKPYGKKAFNEERHFAYVSIVSKKEQKNYYNLAFNAFDTLNNHIIYPHASTNVKNDNPQFYARNAIDGIFETCNHGSWPHSSWGINKQSDAWLKIDFGHEVIIEDIILYLRADFPHDNWWKKITIVFSDRSERVVSLQKTGQGQIFSIEKKQVSWIKLKNLIMSNEESKFPALSQIKAMGYIKHQ